MSLKATESIARATINQFGRSVAHYLFPNDIDYYFVAFELVNADDRPVDYFAFPVTPKSIISQEQQATTIERTFGGITTTKTTTFNPKNITLSGNFGRKFKTILGGRPLSFTGLSFNFQGGIQVKTDFKFDPNELSFQVKTGYGCIKVLERIINRARTLDDQDRPYRLFFYNTSLNQAFLIEIEDFSFQQSYNENMIWNYNLRIRGIADLNEIGGFEKDTLANLLLISNLNKISNSLASNITRAIRR
jgi:hypothetical protein